MAEFWRDDGTMELDGDRHRMIRYMALCFVGAAAFGCAIEVPRFLSGVPPWIAYIVAGIGVAFFLFCAGHWIYLAASGNPHVILNREGALDCRSGLFIAWQDVSCVWIRNKHTLVFQMDRAASMTRRVGVVHRLFHESKGEMWGGDLGIHIGGLRPRSEVVAVYMRAFHGDLFEDCAESRNRED